MKKNVLLHNPRCRKSREAIELLNSNNIDFEVLFYIKNGVDISFIKKLLKILSIDPYFQLIHMHVLHNNLCYYY